MIYLEYPFTFLNEYINKERRNKYAAAKIKKDTTFALTMMLKDTPKIETPCKLKYTWYVKSKRRDGDNISFAKKYVNDSLVKAGIIPNDNLTHLTGFQDDFVISDKIAVRIEVIE